MKLLKLEVEGYRSLKKITWRPGDLNVLIGPNATGKTNLIKVLELLANAADGRLARHVQQEGGMIPMRWDGQAFMIGVEAETSPVSLPMSPRASMDRLDGGRVSGESARSNGQTEVSTVYRLTLLGSPGSSSYGEPADVLFDNPQEDSSGKTIGAELEGRLRDDRDLMRSEDAGDMVDVTEGINKTETLLSTARKPFPLNPRVAAFREQMALWTVHQDVWPGRDSPLRRPAVSSYQPYVSPDGENLVQVLHTLYSQDRDFKQEIDSAMSAAFGDEFDEITFPPDADQRVQLKIRWKSLKRPMSAADLSDGTLRFLFLLAVLANPHPPPLVVVEEPELGLHPSMLPIVAEYAVKASKRTQVIFTTHSPDFLSAFREETPTTTVFEIKDGATELRVLEIKELDYWLEDYSLGEIHRSGQLESM